MARTIKGNFRRGESGRRSPEPNKKVRKFTSKMQSSLLLVFCVCFLLFVGLAIRIAMVSAENSDRYTKRVYSQQTYVSSAIPYRRGDITDRNGTILATSIRTYKVVMDPLTILSEDRYKEPTIDAMVQCFGVDRAKVEEVLTERPNSQYYVIAKNVEEEAKKAYEELVAADKAKAKEDKDYKASIAGVYFEVSYTREYPQKDLASDLIGFTYAENAGNYGIEEYYNSTLNGTAGRSYGYYDSELNLQRTVKDAVDGNSVVTTIDANVQRIVQTEIQKYSDEIGFKNCGVIVMNPNNGEIYAMASAPFYDLNNPRDLTQVYSQEEIDQMDDAARVTALQQMWRNYCISDAYEPGSTFKPVTVACGLEEGILEGNEYFNCPGYAMISGVRIGCAKKSGHGSISLAEAIAYSCNAALMNIGQRIGRANMHNYMEKFGYGRRTGIDLPGEAMGIIFDETQLGPTELATSSFGQGFNVTMVQMASAISSVINGGYYYEPHVVKEIRNAAGAVVEENGAKLVKWTCSTETSNKLRSYMALAVQKGTAVSGQVEGFEIGGKTGTAEKYPRAEHNYLVSFVGFSPVENPEVLVYVVLDQVNLDNQADSSQATRMAGRIFKQILPFLGVYSSLEPEKTEPATKEEETTERETEEGESVVENLPGTEELDYLDIIDDSMGEGVVNETESEVPDVDRNDTDG